MLSTYLGSYRDFDLHASVEVPMVPFVIDASETPPAVRWND